MRAAAFNATVSSAPFPSTPLLGPLNGSDRVNVLMVGYGGGGPRRRLPGRLDPDPLDRSGDRHDTTIPIPRDLWIEGVAGVPQNGKINEVFALGYINGESPSTTRRRALADVALDGHRARDRPLALDRLHRASRRWSTPSAA